MTKRPSKGVYYHRPSKLWRWRIVLNGRRFEFGYFKTEVEAREARDKAIKEILERSGANR